MPGKHARILLYIVDFNGEQCVKGPICSFNAASKDSIPAEEYKGLISFSEKNE